MNAIQLEFPVEEDTEFEIKLKQMQKQIDNMHESMGKVRRKLFSEMTEIKKENFFLRQKMQDMTNEKITWVYDGQKDSLFDVSEHNEPIC